MLWWLFVQVAWHIHTWIYPAHAGRWSGFWTDGIGFLPFVSSFLLAMPLGLPALTIGMALSNAILHLIPPARRVLDKEASRHPGTDYASAQRQMMAAIKISVVVAVPLALIGAATLVHLH